MPKQPANQNSQTPSPGVVRRTARKSTPTWRQREASEEAAKRQRRGSSVYSPLQGTSNAAARMSPIAEEEQEDEWGGGGKEAQARADAVAEDLERELNGTGTKPKPKPKPNTSSKKPAGPAAKVTPQQPFDPLAASTDRMIAADERIAADKRAHDAEERRKEQAFQQKMRNDDLDAQQARDIAKEKAEDERRQKDREYQEDRDRRAALEQREVVGFYGSLLMKVSENNNK